MRRRLSIIALSVALYTAALMLGSFAICEASDIIDALGEWATQGHAAHVQIDPHLAARMRRALGSRKGVTEQKMFGGFCRMLRGNMPGGVEVGRFMFRVGKKREAEALGRPGASSMDITGKPMRGFVWVRADEAEGRALHSWIDLASRFVATLPPK